MNPPPALKDIVTLERSFSAMKASKTHQRSRMDNDTLHRLMRINDSDKILQTYDVTPAIDHWLMSVEWSRHILTDKSNSVSSASQSASSASQFESSFHDKVPMSPSPSDCIQEMMFGDDPVVQVTSL